MGILTDLTNAIETYPHEYLTLKLVEVDPPGAAINEDDGVQFRIQVANSGPLDVNELSLLVEGLNGTEVKASGAAAQWTDSFTIDGVSIMDKIPAHSANSPVVTSGSKYHFKPASSSTSLRDLIRVSVEGWDTDFTHMQVGHSRADSLASVTYSSTVSTAWGTRLRGQADRGKAPFPSSPSRTAGAPASKHRALAHGHRGRVSSAGADLQAIDARQAASPASGGDHVVIRP